MLFLTFLFIVIYVRGTYVHVSYLLISVINFIPYLALASGKISGLGIDFFGIFFTKNGPKSAF
jgi:hypothetical protein